MQRKLFLMLAVFAILCSAFAFGQNTGATVTGLVKDSTGATIPGARIVVTNVGTNVQRTGASNGAGLYSISNVPAGVYKVTITAAGFATGVTNGVQLTVGGEREVDGTLAVGEVTNTVEVNANPADVEIDTSIVSATVGERRIVDLPLNGRDWTQLATLQPGVSNVRSQQSLTSGSGNNRGVRGFGNQITANGHSPYENTYRIDGINENDYSNGAPGSPAGVNLGVDAIQEFSVITTAYTAEYGRTSGAVINAITRSGTNAIHGTAFLFDRDKIFDAESPFDGLANTGKPAFHREQFGGSIGLPIRRDKTFFFVNYEGFRQTQAQNTPQVVPFLAARSGQVTIHNAAGGPLTVNIDPTAAKYLNLFPIATTPNTATCDCGTVVVNGQSKINENFVTARLDQTFSAKNSLSLTYLRDNAPTSVPDLLANTLSLLNSGRQVAALTETHLFTLNLLNVVRVGYNRNVAAVNTPLASLNPEASDTTVGYFPGDEAPLLNVAGYAQAGGFASARQIVTHYNSIQGYDDVSYVHGRNTLKAGVAYERLGDSAAAEQQNGTATFATLSATSTALANFLQSRPYAIDVLPTAGALTPIEPQENLIAGYVQDDLRVGKRLVLNLGIRYEFLTIPTDKKNRLGLINTLTAPAGSPPCPVVFGPTSSPGCTAPASQFFQTNPTKNDYEPRVGFAWNPFGDGTTAVRGGFGIYDQLPLPYIYATYTAIAYPYAQDEVLIGTVPAGSFPFGDAAIAAASTSSHIGRYIDQHPRRDYSSNYNLNVEQQFGKHVSSLVGYVGSHSVHTPFQASEMDQVAPSLVQVIEGRYVYPIPTAAAPLVKQDVNAQTIFGNLFDGSAKYNSLISQVKISQLHNLTAQATYTWSKCTDYGSSTQAPTTYQNSLPGLTYYNKTQRKGACDYNLPQNFSANVLYELQTHFNKGLVNTLTSGFQVGAIVFASSGVPFTVIDNGDVIHQGGLTYASFPDFTPGCNPYNRNFKFTRYNYLNSGCFTLPTVASNSAIVPFCNQGTVPGGAGGRILCTNIQGDERRNSLVGPRIVDADVSLIKNTRIPRISEAFNLQLRVEAFNVLNHSNFQAPTDNFTLGTAASNFNPISVGSAGIIDTLATNQRQVQLGAKFIF